MTPEEFKEHPIFLSLNDLRAKAKKRVSSENHDNIDDLARLALKACDFTQARLSVVDPDLASDAHLTTSKDHINNISVHMENNNLDQLHGTKDLLLKSIAIWPVSLRTDERVEYLDEQIQKATEEMAQYWSDLSDKEGQVSTLEARTQALTDETETIRDSLISVIGDHNEDHRNNQQSLNDTYTETLDELKTSFETWAETKTENIQGFHDRANELLELIAEKGVTGRYRAEATGHFKTANALRALSLLIWVAMIGAVAYLVFGVSKGSFDIGVFLQKVAVIVLGSIPASYAARESTRHRAAGYTLQRKQLELTAMGPFLQNLPEDNDAKQKLLELAEKYFIGGGDEGWSNPASQPSASQLTKILERAHINKLIERSLNDK